MRGVVVLYNFSPGAETGLLIGFGNGIRGSGGRYWAEPSQEGRSGGIWCDDLAAFVGLRASLLPSTITVDSPLTRNRVAGSFSFLVDIVQKTRFLIRAGKRERGKKGRGSKSSGDDNTKTDAPVLEAAGAVVAIGRTAVLRVVVPITTTQQL